MKKFETDELLFPTDWEMVYVEKENPTSLEIMQEAVKNTVFAEVSIFRHSEFEGADSIKNDNDLFYQHGKDCIPYVFQVGPKAADMNGKIIPNTYLVRKIGFWISC